MRRYGSLININLSALNQQLQLCSAESQLGCFASIKHVLQSSLLQQQPRKQPRSHSALKKADRRIISFTALIHTFGLKPFQYGWSVVPKILDGKTAKKILTKMSACGRIVDRGLVVHSLNQ